MARIIVTQNLVRDLLNYDPETGIFTWRIRDRKYFKTDRAHNTWNTRYAGKKAGRFGGNGYVHIVIFNCGFYAHRLAILYITGSFPATEVDHVDRNKTNNRFKNLRVANRTENQQNTNNPLSTSTTQILGAHQTKNKKRFSASITANGKRYHLGTFDTPEQAGVAYQSAKKRLHPAAFALDAA